MNTNLYDQIYEPSPRNRKMDSQSLKGPMNNFQTGQLVLITTPDGDGVSMLAVEWCHICYALIPEDFLDAHCRQMHTVNLP